MLALVSGWTALTEPAVAARWFAWPNLALLAPVPVVTAVVVLALWRSLWGASETLTFRLAALLFLLGFAGLVVSLWPYVVPRHITIWSGAADPQTLWFVRIGIVVIIPIVLALWRSLWGASETLTFRLAALLFLLGFAGLVVSLWPYVVPRHITIWSGAADPQTLWFVRIGIVVIIPIVLAYQAQAYWVFRGKTVVDCAGDERHPAIQARRTSSQAAGLHLS